MLMDWSRQFRSASILIQSVRKEQVFTTWEATQLSLLRFTSRLEFSETSNKRFYYYKMKYLIFANGPSGSGKSSICAELRDRFLHDSRSVCLVNLDPGITKESYY